MAIKADSFANRVRQAVHRVDLGGVISAVSIADAAEISTSADRKRMGCALRDMVRAGELTRVHPGVYLVSQAKDATQPEIREVMWRVLRMRKGLTAEDLMEMAGASQAYAEEWLSTLAKHGVVRADGKGYRLINDTVAMPKLTDNADKIKKWRAKKAAAMAALNQAAMAFDQLRDALNELD